MLYIGRVHLSYRDVGSVLSMLVYFLWKILLENNVDPDQTPHYVASDVGLHSSPMTLLQVSRKILQINRQRLIITK